ncbi:MAG: tetratricopeptide repeat protein [Deinococcota bacterium]
MISPVKMRTVQSVRHMFLNLSRARWLALASLILLSAMVATAQTAEPSLEDLLREGDIYYTRGDCQLSQFIFQEALERDPNNVTALLGQGRGLVCQGAFALGIEAYQQALAVDPNNLTAYIRLSSAYLGQYTSNPLQFEGSLDQALASLNSAESINPNDPRLLNTKGIVLYQIGDYEQAKDALEQAAASAENAPELSDLDLSRIQVNLGRSYRALDQLQLGLTAFRRAVTLDPTNFEARNYLGEALFRQGNCEQGIFELSQAANLAPDDLSTVANLGIALFECGQQEDALVRIEQALEIDGVSIPALYTYLSRIFLAQGRLEEAILEAQKGALLPPTDADSLYWLGQAYQAAGNVASAQESYQRGLDLEPNNAQLLEAIQGL